MSTRSGGSRVSDMTVNRPRRHHVTRAGWRKTVAPPAGRNQTGTESSAQHQPVKLPTELISSDRVDAVAKGVIRSTAPTATRTPSGRSIYDLY